MAVCNEEPPYILYLSFHIGTPSPWMFKIFHEAKFAQLSKVSKTFSTLKIQSTKESEFLKPEHLKHAITLIRNNYQLFAIINTVCSNVAARFRTQDFLALGLDCSISHSWFLSTFQCSRCLLKIQIRSKVQLHIFQFPKEKKRKGKKKNTPSWDIQFVVGLVEGEWACMFHR